MKPIIGPSWANSNVFNVNPSGIIEEARSAPSEEETPTTKRRASASLGTTTILGAPLVPRGSQDIQSTVIDKESGEILAIEPDGNGGIRPVFDSAEFRHKKYQLQAAAADILPYQFKFIKNFKERGFRVAGCLRSVISPDDEVKVYKSKEHGKCHYGGVMVCGSVWTCAICASKITERKSQIITGTVEAHKKAEPEGDVLLITLTFPHSRDDNLLDILDKFREAERGFSKTKAVMSLKREMGFIEPIKSLEITYGHSNGFHPHSHQLWFIKSKTDHKYIKEVLFKHWQKYCIKRGLEAPSYEHGVDVRGGLEAGAYVSKMGWDIGSEVAKGHTKKGKNGRFAPFDLLVEYFNNESQWAKDKFIEYAKATYGRQYVSRFPKLQKLYNLDDKLTDKSDEELAEEKTDNADLVGRLTLKQWKKVCAKEYRALILQLAEESKWDHALRIIDNLPDIKINKKRKKRKPIKTE